SMKSGTVNEDRGSNSPKTDPTNSSPAAPYERPASSSQGSKIQQSLSDAVHERLETDKANQEITDAAKETGPNSPQSMTTEGIPSPTNRVAAAAVENEAVTAGGKTAAQQKKDSQSKESTASAGMSLLDKLRSKGEPEKKPGRTPGNIGREVITRTGRFAIAARTWLQLKTRLSQRFFVSMTQDANRIAASSGQRSLGVMSTEVETLGEEMYFTRTPNNVVAKTRTRREVITQPVTNLPGTVNAIELLQSGDVVLIGFADGRIAARNVANLQDWDLYAQDLFAFQNERRPMVRVADEELIVIREIDATRLFTISASGKGRIWNTADVVRPPVLPLKMTEDQAKAVEAPVLDAVPSAEVELPEGMVLSVTVSPSGGLVAVVSASEQITIIETNTGEIIQTIGPELLNDTQPVTVVLQELPKTIVVGLADGRLLRRAYGDGEPVAGTDENGVEVDYEILFAPEQRDNGGAITALHSSADDHLLYIGRFDGSLLTFDLPRRQVVRTEKLHNSPILGVSHTENGTFSVAADRVLKRSDIPPDPVSQRPSAPETYNLPRDESLQATEVAEPEEEQKQDKFTVRRNFDRDITDAQPENTDLTGIRPSNPVLALYQHQLRVAADASLKVSIRQKIAKLQTPGPNSESLTGEAEPRYNEKPLLVGDVETWFDYTSRPLRRAVMSVSNDGMLVAGAQNYQRALIRGSTPDQPVTVWDNPTGTVLRRWKRARGVTDLHITEQQNLIFPTPLSGMLSLADGELLREQSRPTLTWAAGSNSLRIFVGHSGYPGATLPTLTSIAADSQERQQGLPGFEGAVTGIALAADGNSLFVSLRERTTLKLLEVDPASLQVRDEILSEVVDSAWNPIDVDLQKGKLGPTHIVPSASGKLLLTYGMHADGTWQFRIWKRSGGSKDGSLWKKDDVVIVAQRQDILEREMSDQVLAFVNGGEAQIGVIGQEGVGILDAREGTVAGGLAVPDVAGRRPVSLLSSDGRYFLAGDQEGNVHIWELTKLDRSPQVFEAHSGPISGLAFSANGRYLVTAGEENRIRTWRVDHYLRSSSRGSVRATTQAD
ncbi:MAG: WD40 repeat domain-containing protein, partial [Planctomycetaceae bacterium]|nr:WD40 repeat domain-containing protein [Planctomycetaceae bacterium]